MLYGFASEFGSREWREHNSLHSNWEAVRYELEVKHHMHSVQPWSRCCLFAMEYGEWMEGGRKFDMIKSVRGTMPVTKETRLVLFRRPYPLALARNGGYVPAFFRISDEGEKENRAMTEDEMIAALGSQTMDMLPKRGDTQHPAEYRYNGMCPIPHPKYICHECNSMGTHFRHDCPTNNLTPDKNEHTTRALDRLPRPHGIPKSFLRKVSQVECGAMRDMLGTLYVLETQNPSPPKPPNHSPPPVGKLPVAPPPVDKLPVAPPCPTVKNFGMAAFMGLQYDKHGKVVGDALAGW